MGVPKATCVATTEMYPDSPKATGGLDYIAQL